AVPHRHWTMARRRAGVAAAAAPAAAGLHPGSGRAARYHERVLPRHRSAGGRGAAVLVLADAHRLHALGVAGSDSRLAAAESAAAADRRIPAPVSRPGDAGLVVVAATGCHHLAAALAGGALLPCECRRHGGRTMNAVLRLDRAGKAYRRYPSRWARLREWLTGRQTHQPLWVFREVSFSLGAGESLGIVGRNGAGKTTLLRLIAGITRPTEGSVVTEGRVAALLELGMGFHPDFDGRENAIIGCQLLGMTAQEIASSLPEIEAFAEIGDYFRRPVRQYSSGMQMRLAFAVATAVRPDLLIVDEAMAVGDAYFQHK